MPKYFPKIVDEREPAIAVGTVETLAFVLCGADPSERTNPALVPFSLRQLLANANVKRVGTVSGLREDHQFLLAPRFDFAKVDFEDVWKEARDVRAGQESTNLLKLIKKLQRLRLDSSGSELLAPKMAPLIDEIRTDAHHLLYRAHRTAIRHIEDALKSSTQAIAKPWYDSLLTRVGLKRQQIATAVHVDEEILKEASRYFEESVKLGRVMRARVR